jgi:hypothetical protein
VLKPSTIKALKENIGEKGHDIGCENDFLDVTLKAMTAKTKIETQRLCVKQHSRGKDKPMEWEKIFVNIIPTNVNIQNILLYNINKQVDKKELNKHFSKNDIKMGICKGAQ